MPRAALEDRSAWLQPHARIGGEGYVGYGEMPYDIVDVCVYIYVCVLHMKLYLVYCTFRDFDMVLYLGDVLHQGVEPGAQCA